MAGFHASISQTASAACHHHLGGSAVEAQRGHRGGRIIAPDLKSRRGINRIAKNVSGQPLDEMPIVQR